MHRRTALTPFELFSGANAGAPLSGLLADVKDIMSFGAGGIRYQGTADPAPTFDAPRPVLPPISPVLHMSRLVAFHFQSTTRDLLSPDVLVAPGTVSVVVEATHVPQQPATMVRVLARPQFGSGDAVSSPYDCPQRVSAVRHDSRRGVFTRDRSDQSASVWRWGDQRHHRCGDASALTGIGDQGSRRADRNWAGVTMQTYVRLPHQPRTRS